MSSYNSFKNKLLIIIIGTIFLISNTESINNGQISPFQPHVAHIMSIRQPVGNQPSVAYGGGSIISARHVLTAARLVHGFTAVQIGYGSVTLLNLALISANRIAIHPQYVPQTFQNDIAILAIPVGQTWDIRFNVVPIRWSANSVLPAVGVIGTTAGFGYTFAQEGFPSTTKRMAQLTVTGVCTGTTITPSHFCGMTQPGWPSNLCEGDQGNGFWFNDGAGLLLVGIGSVIPAGCNGHSGAGFTRVGFYAAWINQNLF